MTMIITPKLDVNLKESIYIQLYRYIRDEIVGSRLKEHERLPSIRKLSDYLMLSRTTVENAYNQLLVEGYIYSQPQKGYYVSAINVIEAIHKVSFGSMHEGKLEQQFKPAKVDTYDYKNEYIEACCFDVKIWKKHINYVINEMPQVLMSQGDPYGELMLKEEIASYFYRTRGVKASPSNIIVGSGVQTLLERLAHYFIRGHSDSLLMEDPGFIRAKRIFTSHGMTLEALPVKGDGFDRNRLWSSEAKVCYVSPSHQFPTGHVLPIQERYELLRWALDRNGYIIEDDFNAQLRYYGQPIPAMQGLDEHGRVIYLGSFSTMLSPAIRISFLVVPDSLKSFIDKEAGRIQTASKIEQLALGSMLKTGDFDKHTKKIRHYYAKKYIYLIDLIKKYLSIYGEVRAVEAGLFLLFDLKQKGDILSIVTYLETSGVVIDFLGKYYLENDEVNRRNKATSENQNALIFNFRGIPWENMEKSIKLIKDLLNKYFEVCYNEDEL